MKKYDFNCGGDRGAWECVVTVELTEDEEKLMKEYAKNDNRFLTFLPPYDTVYAKVIEGLSEQCEDDFDIDTLVIFVPYELKED